MESRCASQLCIIKKHYTMKIVLTGSLGHISRPLAIDLITKGHSVTVISSKAEKQKEIEALGAQAAVGSMFDVDFLASTFRGTDIVYLMEPPFNFFDHSIDLQQEWLTIADNYVKAVRQSGVAKVVHLSSIGGHTDQGVGMLAAHHLVERILQTLPDNVAIKTMRPVGFYYNIFAFIPTIQNAGVIIQNYGGDAKEPWVAPDDIAAVIAEEMEKPFDGRRVRYIASDEVSPNELVKMIGSVIGKSDLTWQVISDEQFRDNLLNVGFSRQAADGLTAMNAGRRSQLYDDYHRHRPVLSKTKLADFMPAFTVAYHAAGTH